MGVVEEIGGGGDTCSAWPSFYKMVETYRYRGRFDLMNHFRTVRAFLGDKLFGVSIGSFSQYVRKG